MTEAQAYVDQAKAALAPLGPSPAATALADGADHLVTMVAAAST